jgi:excinuclease ABC subunit C
MATDYSSVLEQKLAALEARSGCYLFKDSKGTIVYVGKAKSLRARVRSYFQKSSSDNRAYLPTLLDVVTDVETMVTASEKEAAVLENELVKQHQPRFNVKLRDDKDFLCLRLESKNDWPRLETVRRPEADGAQYFGPYHSATSARRTLHLVNKHFKLRTCTDADMRARRRPCLQFQIKRCAAPCVYQVDKGWYAGQVRAVALFLEDRHDELTKELEQQMNAASSATDYELAAIYRDQLRAVEAIRLEQRVVTVRKIDQDVIGLYREGPSVELVMLIVRQGHVVDSRSYSLGPTGLPDQEIVAGFLGQYYGRMDRGEAATSGLLPDEVLVPVLPDAAGGLAEWLSEHRGKKVRLAVPRQGPTRKLLEMAQDNAAHAFHEKQRATADMDSKLEELQRILRLDTVPRIIECVDISHLGGGDAYGGIVCLKDGEPHKKRYKLYRVRTTTDGDDYAAIYEVLARRFRRGRDSEPPPHGESSADGDGWELPDLFVIDGGRGQLGIAHTAARDLGLHDLAIVSLAKERESRTGEKIVDRVYLPGQKNGILLRPKSPALYLLARARDEAHRFSNKAREKSGKKRRLRSELDDVRGIGADTKKALLRELGSMQAVRAASDEAILAVSGVTRRHLTALRKVIPAPERQQNADGEAR